MRRQKNTVELLDEKKFDAKIDGGQIKLYTLTNANGLYVQLTNYGARVVSLWTPDARGNWDDIVLGFPSIQAYLNAREKYHGATIGRFANRIANGSFQLKGKNYQLASNNGSNHLHGGNKGFESRIWGVNEYTRQTLRLTYISPHLEEGYPGELSVMVTYTLTDDNALEIRYHAITDRTTVINLTNHSYFNLKGEGEKDITSHYIKIFADRYTPINEDLLPSGSLDSVQDTPMDFRKGKILGKGLDMEFTQLRIANGYDHNFAINDGHQEKKVAAIVGESSSGRQMKVHTDQAGVQFYTANFLDGSDTGKSGRKYTSRSSFCLETQHFPDSPNQDAFPSTILSPEEEFSSVTSYQFGLTT